MTISFNPKRRGLWNARPEVVNFLKENKVLDNVLNLPKKEMLNHSSFIDTFKSYILNSKFTKVKGLDTFNEVVPCLGLTEILNEFYYQHKNIKVLKGEYPYTRTRTKCEFVEDSPLQKGDAFLVSIPFSASGTIHPKTYQLFKICEDLDIPVLVDCAWFGTCGDMNIDLRSSAIKQVGFSTSKAYSKFYRAGIRFSRDLKNDSDSLFIHDRTQWLHYFNLKINEQLLKNHSADFLFEKYRDKQLKICKELNIIPSNCIHIGLGGEEYKHCNRDNTYNRVNIIELLEPR